MTSSSVMTDQVKVGGNDDDDDISRVEQTTQNYEYKVTEINHVTVENQGSYFESQVTVNDSGLPPKLLNNNNKEWNYSLLTVRNENIKVNDPLTTTTTSTTPSSSTSKAFNNMQKKPIFNDLLKVPYDVLNAPLVEAPKHHEQIQKTQIHINHQQKINDTITNYQHFQQFIQKSPQQHQQPASIRSGYYQSTPMPEQNYEVDESVSLMTNGRAHGVQSTTQKPPLQIEKILQPSIHAQLNIDGQDAKFGVVFEGRDFRKYKVEEKTADGFIVG